MVLLPKNPQVLPPFPSILRESKDFPKKRKAALMKSARYYGITFIEQRAAFDRSGWERVGADWYRISGPCQNQAEATEQAERDSRPINRSSSLDTLVPQTEHMNLQIVSSSQLRLYGISENTIRGRAEGAVYEG